MGKIKECKVYLEDNKHHSCLSKIIRYDKRGRIKYCVDIKRSAGIMWNPILQRFPIAEVVLYKCFRFGPLSILVENWFDPEEVEKKLKEEKEVPATPEEIEEAKNEEEKNSLKVKECYFDLFGRISLKINEEHYERKHFRSGKLVRIRANDMIGNINDLKVVYSEDSNVDPIRLELFKVPEPEEGKDPIDPLYGTIVYDWGLQQYSFKSKDNTVEVLFEDAELSRPTYAKLDDPMFGREMWFEYYDGGELKLKRIKQTNAPADAEKIYRYVYK